MSGRIVKLLINSFPQILLPGIAVTIPLALVSFAIGLVLALIAAISRTADIPVLRSISKFYVWVFRGTPLLVQIFIIFYGLPAINITLAPLPAAVIAFSLNVGAYASETLRGAIIAVPKGQLEAGYCVGMTYPQAMKRIILPQAFRIAVPPLSNSFIGLVKDTSLAANITVTEMFMATQRIAATTYEPMAMYCEAALIYLLFCTVLSRLQILLEKKFSVSS